MSHEPIRDALALFREACDKPRDERSAFLDAACGQDAELRAQVESMLAWDDAEDAAADDAAVHPVRAALSNLANEAESSPAPAAPLPNAIGGYSVLRLIAHGGMGAVYEARQAQPQRRVAIKVAHRGASTGERARRFQLEAELLARLRHPGIAQIIEAGTTAVADGARPFFVMEYVEGRTLTDHAADRLPLARQKLELMVAVCAAVAFAHSQGVVHRDLKPDNVLVEADGSPRILDFGIAKIEETSGFGDATMHTEEGRILGTLGYMAPEQLAGSIQQLGPAADVYSLGVMIYELLSGRLPHELTAATFTRALAVVTSTDAPLLGVIRPEYRGDIEALVARALEKDPRHRYPDAAALQADLERYLRGEPIHARPAGPMRRLTKWARRNPASATAVFGVFLALAMAATVLLVKNQEVQAALADNLRLLDTRRLRLAKQDADELQLARPDRAAAIRHWLDENRRLLDRTAEHRAMLEQLRERHGTQVAGAWTFTDTELGNKHAELERLVQGLEELARDTQLFQRMQARLDLAGSIARTTVDERRADWDAAIARVRDNPRYGKLVLQPQVGLIPLGEDPDSHLEEFLHFETHEGPIPPAGNGARNTLAFDGNTPAPQTGIVLVLIPGGTYWMGAQMNDAGGRNYDPMMTDPELMAERLLNVRVHEVPVEPFLLSKYEMTIGQWRRAVGPRSDAGKQNARPITNVSWLTCNRVVAQLGLALPTEEQWEYAARAGVAENPPRWWTGPDEFSLKDKENILDETTTARFQKWTETSGEVAASFTDDAKQRRFDENELGPAPVGSYRANGFGLFDIGGNVSEWCADVLAERGRSVRGGNIRRSAKWARSAARIPFQPAMELEELGLRPACLLERRRAR